MGLTFSFPLGVALPAPSLIADPSLEDSHVGSLFTQGMPMMNVDVWLSSGSQQRHHRCCVARVWRRGLPWQGLSASFCTRPSRGLSCFVFLHDAVAEFLNFLSLSVSGQDFADSTALNNSSISPVQFLISSSWPSMNGAIFCVYFFPTTSSALCFRIFIILVTFSLPEASPS